MGGNRRQAGEREAEEEGFSKEDPVGCDSGGGKHKVFSYPLLLLRRWKSWQKGVPLSQNAFSPQSQVKVSRMMSTR